jgi:hypothetical protein
MFITGRFESLDALIITFAASCQRPGTRVRNVILYNESDPAAYAGEFSKVRDLTRRASVSAQHADEEKTGAAYEAESAVAKRSLEI